MNYYPRHIGDYVSATAHLSMIEDGAYSRLLDWYYQDEKPLPADKRAIYRRIRASSEAEREAVDIVLAEFFTLDANAFRHSRCDAEIERAQSKSEKAKTSAKQRWNANAMRTHDQSDANASKAICEGNATRARDQQPIANSQEPIAKEEETSLRLVVPDGVGNRPNEAADDDENPGGRRLPACPAVDVVALYHEVLPELPRVERLTEARRAAIRQRWREWAVEKGWETTQAGLDEWRGFFGYVRQSKFLMGQVQAQNGRQPFVADLEWLMRPSNHVKVYEGKYHNA